MSSVRTATNPFSRRALRWLVGLCVVSFIAALVFAAFGSDPGEVPDHRPTSYSRSAIGHRGFVKLLEKVDIPVVVSRYDSLKKALGRGVLVVAEPRTDPEDLADLKQMANLADVALIVLPKRTGYARSRKTAFIESSDLVDIEAAADVMHAAGVEGNVVREGYLAAIRTNELAIAPAVAEPQLMVPGNDRTFEPIIETDDGGVLLGKLRDRQIWILADPDLIANHGLIVGDNAALALALIDRLRSVDNTTGNADDDRTVIFDETLHGNKAAPSPWHELVEMPLVLATLAGLLAACVLLWSAMGRFGAPVPARLGLEPGKGFLIANTAALIGLGGHSTHALSRYLATTVQDVAHRSHAPADLAPERLRDWLNQVGKSRKLSLGLRDLEADVEAAGRARRRRAERVVTAALQIYDWRIQMTSERG